MPGNEIRRIELRRNREKITTKKKILIGSGYFSVSLS